MTLDIIERIIETCDITGRMIETLYYWKNDRNSISLEELKKFYWKKLCIIGRIKDVHWKQKLVTSLEEL
jgi:hypothetical protein